MVKAGRKDLFDTAMRKGVDVPGHMEQWRDSEVGCANRVVRICSACVLYGCLCLSGKLEHQVGIWHCCSVHVMHAAWCCCTVKTCVRL